MSASLPEAEMTDVHRLFLQGMMWKRICDSNEISKIHKQSLETCEVPLPKPEEIPNALFEIVTTINSNLKPLNLSIVKCIDERTGKNYYALINGVDNSISRLSTEYSQTELELFKKIVESIVHSCDGHITSIEALNLTLTMAKRVNKSDAQEIIKRFLRDKWLCQADKGILYLSPRCIAELDFYITTSYGDAVSKCHLCQHTVIMAVRCSSCKVRIHKHCIQKFLTEQNCCPKCHKGWEEYSGPSEEEEDEGEEEEEEMEEGTASNSTKGRKRVRE